jgi:hypothetical protein
MRGGTRMSHHLADWPKKSAQPLDAVGALRSAFAHCTGRESRRKTGHVTARRGGTRQRDVTRASNLTNASVVFKGGAANALTQRRRMMRGWYSLDGTTVYFICFPEQLAIVPRWRDSRMSWSRRTPRPQTLLKTCRARATTARHFEPEF